jgi:hypothetical protein
MDTNSGNHTHKNSVLTDKKQEPAHYRPHAWEYQNRGQKSTTPEIETEQEQKTPTIIWGLNHF